MLAKSSSNNIHCIKIKVGAKHLVKSRQRHLDPAMIDGDFGESERDLVERQARGSLGLVGDV